MAGTKGNRNVWYNREKQEAGTEKMPGTGI